MALGSQIGFLSLTFCVQPIEWDSLWGNLSVFMSQITLLGGESLIVSSKSTQEGIFLSIAHCCCWRCAQPGVLQNCLASFPLVTYSSLGDHLIELYFYYHCLSWLDNQSSGFSWNPMTWFSSRDSFLICGLLHQIIPSLNPLLLKFWKKFSSLVIHSILPLLFPPLSILSRDWYQIDSISLFFPPSLSLFVVPDFFAF